MFANPSLYLSLLLQDGPNTGGIIFMVVVFLLLLALFVWLVMSGWPLKKAGPRAEETPAAAVPPVGVYPPVETDDVTSSAEITAPDILVESESEALEESMVEAALAEEPAAPIEPAAPLESAAADDLEIIEGIGPKIAGILNQAGVTTFAQLAAMTPEEIAGVVRAGGVNLVDPGSWPEQARLAANGDQAGLQALQDSLKAGRE